ncbi:hypothetical protein PBI_SCTP2_156 [Salicola phage SCTP-2]|nr:hypothetical protein PBI_SCTP2_156 [Salicola phage SCTP-2]
MTQDSNNNDNQSSENSRNLLEEIMQSRCKLTEGVIKTRADHTINSAINLLEEIEEKYGEDAARLLEKRLVSAIKSKNPKRFKFSKK